MRPNFFRPISGLLLIFLLLLAACGGAEAPEPVTPTDSPTVAPTETPVEEPAAEADMEGQDTTAADDGTAAAAGATTFVVDSSASSASYIVDEEFLEEAFSKLGIQAGETVVVGTTPAVSGEMTLDLSDLSNPVGQSQFTVDLSQLSTDQANRDRWIRNDPGGPQFGNSPQATFVITELSGMPQSYTEGETIEFEMTGDLTVLDVTRSITFDVTATLEGDTLTATARANEVLMSSFGIEPPSFLRTLTVADPFDIEINLTARADG